MVNGLSQAIGTNYNSYFQVNEVVSNHLRRLLTEDKELKDEWQCIVDQGDLKVFKRELEENGVPLDPMKAVCTVKVSNFQFICNFVQFLGRVGRLCYKY